MTFWHVELLTLERVVGSTQSRVLAKDVISFVDTCSLAEGSKIEVLHLLLRP